VGSLEGIDGEGGKLQRVENIYLFPFNTSKLIPNLSTKENIS